MSNPLTDKQKIEAMAATADTITDLLQKRMKQRVDTLTTLSSTALDNVPESVKKMREEEASKIRAVIQEQADLIDIVKVLFPSPQKTDAQN